MQIWFQHALETQEKSKSWLDGVDHRIDTGSQIVFCRTFRIILEQEIKHFPNVTLIKIEWETSFPLKSWEYMVLDDLWSQKFQLICRHCDLFDQLSKFSIFGLWDLFQDSSKGTLGGSYDLVFLRRTSIPFDSWFPLFLEWSVKNLLPTRAHVAHTCIRPGVSAMDRRQ